MRRLIMFFVVACPVIGFAQDQSYQSFEITPTLSFRQGGSIILEERAFLHGDFALDIVTTNTIGLRLAIPVNQRFAIELMGSRQASEIKTDEGFFGWVPGAFWTEFDADIVDIDVTYYHVGVVWDIGQAATRGYLVGSAGITEIDLKNLPLPKETPLSVSIGGGVQWDLSDHFGLLFELRYFYTDTDGGISVTEEYTHRDCSAPCTYTWRYESGMTQTEITFGFVFKP